jgi:hypothetical protein
VYSNDSCKVNGRNDVLDTVNSWVFVAAVSGVTPDDPVVSRQSGLLYERRLILKHLEVLHNLS